MNITGKIRFRINSFLNFHLFQKRGIPKVKNEQVSKSVMRKYLPDNPVIIDCGAHIGNDSIELNRICNATVHAFEPVHEIFDRLQKNTARYKNIHCYRIALSDRSGRQHFFVSRGGSDASSSLLEPKEHLIDHPDTSFDLKIEVDTLTLDDWAAQHNIAKVDMLWLDMQGFEMNMLKESAVILPTVKVIHTEVSTKETYKAVNLYKDFSRFLKGKGFETLIEAIPAGADMGNVVFIKTK